jgi:hypothetical protein
LGFGIINHNGINVFKLPYIAACIDDTIHLRLSGNTDGVIFSATFSQKSSNFVAGSSSSFFEPAIIAALMAPIEVPAIMSNFIPRLASVLYTPHSYAPRDLSPLFSDRDNFLPKQEP